ncbi:hypothetical protein [Nocardia salmonicida]|uniref:hypothetical protein n=1 Tax=Nocardia salmonicida TaxID=53431 RepID=UPI000ADB9FA7|nr:hypothetical protein [Nocardia salmonicida]
MVELDIEIRERDLIDAGIASMDGGGQSSTIAWKLLPDSSVVLYKRYDQTSLLTDSRQRLGEWVRWRRGLSSRDREYLDARAAWVRHVVLDADSNVAGVVVPAAPDEFWVNKRGTVSPRDMGEMLAQRERARRHDKEYFNVPHTMARLGHFLETLAFLHQRGVIVGDLHRGNVLISRFDTTPATYLLDCDATLFDGKRALKPAEREGSRGDHIVGWPDELDRRTDMYKFGLMAVQSIAKTSSMAADDTVGHHMLRHHRDMLNRFLRLEAADASATDASSMAAAWKACVGIRGERGYRDNGLLPIRWDGESCFVPASGPTRSPAHRAVRRTTAASTRNMTTTKASSARPTKTASRPAQVPSGNSERFEIILGAMVLVVGLAIVVALIAVVWHFVF